MESLKFNSGGQWELIKATGPYSSPSGGISTPRAPNEPGNDFKAFRSTTGKLREDHDSKGELHGNPGNKRAPKQGLSPKNWGKPYQMLPSSKINSEPGGGPQDNT
jgi:hypothetical protein